MPDFSSSLERRLWVPVLPAKPCHRSLFEQLGRRTSPGKVDGTARLVCVVDAMDQENVGRDGSPPRDLDPAARRTELRE